MIIDGTTIAWASIPEGIPGTRRQREREVVLSLLRDTLGYKCVIGHDDDGAPLLDGWHISISHSIDLAVVALNREIRIGIDAETWREALKRVQPKFLSESEMEHCQSSDALLRAWTAKEAVYKAAGIRLLPFVDGIKLNASLSQASTPSGDFAISYLSVGKDTIALATPLK